MTLDMCGHLKVFGDVALGFQDVPGLLQLLDGLGVGSPQLLQAGRPLPRLAQEIHLLLGLSCLWMEGEEDG